MAAVVMSRAAAVLTIVLLAACDPYALQRRQALDASFVGHGETELVRILGVPTRTIVSGDHRFLAYDEGQTEIQPPIYPWHPWGWGFGPDFGPGLPAQVVQYLCETTFEVTAGTVTNYSLRGNACG